LNEHGLHSLWATAAIYLLAWLLVVARAPRATLAAMSNPALLALAGASGVTNACFNWGVATGDVVQGGLALLPDADLVGALRTGATGRADAAALDWPGAAGGQRRGHRAVASGRRNATCPSRGPIGSA
jgi:hypothetical protein